jgi:hypothetical protein
MSDVAHSGPPAHWAVEGGEVLCLSCRRTLAGESAVDGVDGKSSREEREQVRKNAMIEFELRRVPDRNNAVIARSCRTSPRAVANVRKRLG